MKRNAFLFRREYYDLIKGLPCESIGRLFEAIAAFMLDNVEPNLTNKTEVERWSRLRPILQRDLLELMETN